MVNDKHVGIVRDHDKHTGMVGVNDTYGGPTLQKENESQNPTLPHKAFFLPGVNKKAN